ncbi:hypothetical protein OUZ56_007954 [Daphnia magna]|uniref:Uncharacterized protein n=1 Tax=Daphnia magna TaxID=35525 RepID=A0ABR0ABJ6_9CRUS|nr:hypothetical protein OUZ56_007954 [Daphnia magna]
MLSSLKACNRSFFQNFFGNKPDDEFKCYLSYTINNVYAYLRFMNFCYFYSWIKIVDLTCLGQVTEKNDNDWKNETEFPFFSRIPVCYDGTFNTAELATDVQFLY